MKIETGKSFKGEWQFGFTICRYLLFHKRHTRIDLSLFKRHVIIHIN